MIAGPNGCGKSTLTRISGFSTLDMIDPDEILRHSPSLGPIVAAREALRRRRRALDRIRERAQIQLEAVAARPASPGGKNASAFATIRNFAQ